MKEKNQTPSFHRATSLAKSARQGKRFGQISLVFCLAITGLILLFWQINANILWAQTPETPTAITRYVTPDGSPSNDCTNPAAPCSLQRAMVVALNGDEVRLAGNPGMPYTNVNLVVSRSITIVGGYLSPSWGEPDPVFNQTILDANNNGRVIQILANVSPVINGLHIRNGQAAQGAGINIVAGSGNPTIQGNWIYDNAAAGVGGGLYVGSARATIAENEIHNNAGTSGAGIFVFNSGSADPVNILFNDIHHNTASSGSDGGAGIYINSDSRAFVEGNTIHNNTAQGHGGGIFIFGNAIVASQNNMFYQNTGTNGGAMRASGAITSWHDTIVANNASSGGGFYITGPSTSVQISNTIVASNTATIGESGIHHASGAVTGTNNNIHNNSSNVTLPNVIPDDPEFINLSIFNLHLRQTSPNISMAAPSSVSQDIDRQARPEGPNPDIGADEFYPNIPAFSFTPPRIDHYYADRGTVQSYNHRVTNENTSDDDTYTFVCANSQGWTVTCPTPQAVPLGDFITVTTQVAVPAAAPALTVGDTVITATSTISPGLSHAVLVRTVVRPLVGIQFTPNYSTTVPPGQSIILMHTLTNTGDAPDVFTVNIASDSLDWADLLPSDPLEVPLGVGASANVQVEVTAPPHAAGIIPNVTVIRATSSYDVDAYAEVVDTVRAEQTIGTRYVRANAATDVNNNCTQPTYPCQSVGHGIDQAVTNDAVHVAFGDYTLTANTQMNETIHLSGSWGDNFQEQDVGPTRLLPTTGGSFQLFTLSGAANRSSFDSLTLEGGVGTAARGGAVVINSGVQASFNNVIIQDSTAGRGGAVQVYANALAIFNGTRFINNTADVNGGALHVEGGTVVLRNVLFAQNEAAGNGGALYVQNGGVTINHNTIANNSANAGGALYVANSGSGSFRMVNSILSGNSAGSGGFALHVQGGTANVDYVNFFNNQPGDTGGPGNINITNQFNLPPGFVDGDPEFRLESISLMVDRRPRNTPPPTDELYVDFEGDNRPSDQGFDLGYDELAGCAAKRDDTVYGSIQEAVDVTGAQSNLIQVSGICRGVNAIVLDGRTVSQTVHITGAQTLIIQGGWNGNFSERWPTETTIVDPQGQGRALITSGPVSVTLEFITLVNGNAAGLAGGPADADAGGGVYNHGATLTLRAVSLLTSTAVHGGALYNHSGTLQTDLLVARMPGFLMPADASRIPLRSEMRANSASGNGGAVYVQAGTVHINGAMVLANTAVNGGGIYHAAGALTAANSALAFNSASGDGGGVFNNAATPGSAALLHLTFYDNTAGRGGGVFNQGSSPITMRSNIFQSNDATAANGGDAIFATSAANENYNYYHAQPQPIAGGLVIGANSINSATPPGLLDPAGVNFHLSNEAPAVDRGDPLSPVGRDFDGELRPSDQGPDMGADEVAGCRVELNGVFYGSIQAAMADAQPGDTIRVAGRCSGVHLYNTGGGSGGCGGDTGIIQTTVHIDKDIILQGGWDEEFTTQGEEATVLDAMGLGRVVHIAASVSATVEGFHIVNGALTGANANGAGICIDQNASPTIRHNEVTTNTATRGAAIYSVNSSAVIDGNRIHHNQANAQTPAYGGGLFAVSGNGTAVSIWNNFIYANSANTHGGAFHSESGNHRFWHNTVVENTLATSPGSNQGAAVYVATGNPEIRSNIFLGNDGPATDGVHCTASANPLVTYNNAFAQDVNYGGAACDDGNNISLDPLLTVTYTLNLNSPMLDAGDPAITLAHDFAEDIRPSHLGFDIGADEIGGCVARNLGNPGTIYSSLQLAVDEAGSGDTIEVDGVCLNAKTHPSSGGSVQNLFVNKTLTIDGDWESGLVPNSQMTATLNALDNGRVLYVAAAGVLTLTNIHLYNGDANGAGLSSHGGGLYNAGALFMDNVYVLANTAVNGGGVYNVGNLSTRLSFIEQNSAGQGGGVYNNGGTAVFTETNRIFNNSVSSGGNGGGVHQNAGTIWLDSNYLYANTAPNGNGGGVYLAGAGTIFVRNNFVYQNSAARGGGLYNHNTSAPIWHNTFYRNTATTNQGGGLYSTPAITIRSNIMDFNTGSGIHVANAGANIDYNNVVANFTGNYSGNAAPGANDISSTPEYVNAAAGDLHLRSDSPGVDDADPNPPFNYDIDGHLRPTNGGPDRGADEINSCLIRVNDRIFGVLQFAIDYAESSGPPFPLVEIARGECSGVRQDATTNTLQVGIIRQDLVFEGSLRRLDFQYVGDYLSDEVGTISSRINAAGQGRALYIVDGANPRFRHLAFVNGNAFVAGGGNNGGGVSVPGSGSLEFRSAFVCESMAEHGAGVYLSPTSSGAGVETYITGSRIGFCTVANVLENADGSVDGVFYINYDGNSASGNGGGLYSEGPWNMSNTGFWENSAGQNGGGVYSTASDTRMINGIFYLNEAAIDGGAIYNAGANLRLYHNTITQNEAGGLGGGLRQVGNGFVLNSSIIDENSAATDSGLSVSGTGHQLTHNNFHLNSSNIGFGSNFITDDPLLFLTVPSRFSPVLDIADPSLLNPGVPPDGTSIDFDARLSHRPDGLVTPHTGVVSPYQSDLGAYEYRKDFGCTVTPESVQQTAVPGSFITLTLSVNNTGFPYPPSDFIRGFRDSITVTLSSDPGWGGLVGGDLQTFENVNWFESRPITLVVSVPGDAQGGDFDTSAITCTSWSRPDRSRTAQVTTYVGLVSGILVLDEYSTSAAPGDVLTFTHRVRNIGNQTGNFVIRPDAGAQHASAVLLDASNNPITETVVTLASGQEIEVQLQVTILSTALRGDSATPGVVAQEVDNPLNFSSRYNNILILGIPGTRYVALGGQDTTNCTDLTQPCGTINHAIFAAEAGDPILVAEGTYVDTSAHDIGGETFLQNVFISKTVTIHGGYSTVDDFAVSQPITRMTRLDGQGLHRVIYITPSITVTLSGLFVYNGDSQPLGAPMAYPEYGGGIYNAGADLTITATFVVSNNARYGGGIYQDDNTLTVNSSVFAGNSDENLAGLRGRGGGIFVSDGTAVLENNTFVSNQATAGDGGGDGYGGAVYQDAGDLTSLNNIFNENRSTTIGSAVYVTGTANVITSNYNLYWDNDINFITGTNSLVAEPHFLDAFYHLSSTSPAKDAGTENTSRAWAVDYELGPRIEGPTIDIGADERVQRPDFTFTPITATAIITVAEIYTYQHTLQNIGDFADSYDLNMVNVPVTPGGLWTHTLIPPGNTGVLTPGQSITVMLVITGSTPGAIDQTIITAASTYSPTLTRSVTDTTTVTFTPGVDIEPSLAADGIPAVATTYDHVLTNTGDGIDQFEIRLADATPPGWEVSISPTQTGFISPTEQIAFIVNVTPPAGTAPGTVHTATVEARSLNTLGIEATDTLTDVTTVIEAPGLLLTPVTQTQTVAPDVTLVEFFHTLQNVGNVDDTPTLAVAGFPEEWLVTVEPAAVSLAPLQTAAVTVTVIVPPNSGGMVHTAYVTATSTVDPAVQALAEDTTIVQTFQGVIIEPDYTRTVDAPSIQTYTHTITNTGNTIDAFALTAVSSLTWTTDVTPDEITLAAGESGIVLVTVDVPPEAQPGASNVTTVTATSQFEPTVFDTAVDITNIRQYHSLIFEPNRTVFDINPGTQVVFTHYLTNTGNGVDNFAITADTMNGWPVLTPPGEIVLAPGAGATVLVTQSVPLGADGMIETMWVTATSTISPTATASVEDTTRVTGTAGQLDVLIEPDNSSAGAPGGTVVYQHTVTNTGGVAAAFLLSVVSQNGWTVSVAPDTVTLLPGEATGVEVVVIIPAAAPVGSMDETTVTAAAQALPGVFDTAVDTTTVSGDTTYGVIIEPDQTGAANAGETIAYTHTVTNTGSVADTYNLTVQSSHPGWNTTVNPAQVTLNAGASTTVVASLEVPVGAVTTVNVMTVTAVSVNAPTISDTAIDTTNVTGETGVRSVVIEPDNAAVAGPGSVVQYNHLVTNTGEVADMYVITAVSTQGWNIITTPGPGDTFQLAPGQSAAVVVRVTVPGTAVNGMVDVTTVTVSSIGSPATDLARDTTTVEAGPPTIYLPIILKPSGTPPPPTTPTPTVPAPTPTTTTLPPTPTPCAPHTGIDLIVTNIQVAPTSPGSGQPATVYVTIRNQGSVSVPYGNNFFLDLYVDRTPQPYLVGDIVWGVQGADLTAGTSQMYEATYTFGGGAHQLWAQVDTDRHVDECPMEHNNTFGPVTLTVTGAPEQIGAPVVPQYGPRQTPTPVAPTVESTATLPPVDAEQTAVPEATAVPNDTPLPAETEPPTGAPTPTGTPDLRSTPLPSSTPTP